MRCLFVINGALLGPSRLPWVGFLAQFLVLLLRVWRCGIRLSCASRFGVDFGAFLHECGCVCGVRDVRRACSERQARSVKNVLPPCGLSLISLSGRAPTWRKTTARSSTDVRNGVYVLGAVLTACGSTLATLFCDIRGAILRGVFAQRKSLFEGFRRLAGVGVSFGGMRRIYV